MVQQGRRRIGLASQRSNGMGFLLACARSRDGLGKLVLGWFGGWVKRGGNEGSIWPEMRVGYCSETGLE